MAKTKKELEKRINELEKIVEQLSKMIEQQSKMIDILQSRERGLPPYQIVDNNPDICIDGLPHEYPSPWHGVIPPCCKKCGKQGFMVDIVYAEQRNNANGTDYAFFNENGKEQIDMYADNKTHFVADSKYGVCGKNTQKL